MGQNHHLDGLAQVVEYQEMVRQDKPGLGHRFGRGKFRQALDIAHHVIPQKAHQAAPEPGQARRGHGLEFLEHLAYMLERVRMRV